MAKRKKTNLDRKLKDNKLVLIDLDNCKRKHFNSKREVVEKLLYQLDRIDGMEIVVKYMNSYGGDYSNGKP